MKSTLHTLTALLIVGLYFLLTAAKPGESQHVPTRCECQKSNSAVRGPFSDYKVSLAGTGCPRVEIMMQKKGQDEKKCLKRLGRPRRKQS
ncbi:hypothetical protein NFI96_022995 [Prochilodus magdalenae]|nr:hypothetical protein NFI96_022995 [Prochilodus magdalenae]